MLAQRKKIQCKALDEYINISMCARYAFTALAAYWAKIRILTNRPQTNRCCSQSVVSDSWWPCTLTVLSFLIHWSEGLEFFTQLSSLLSVLWCYSGIRLFSFNLHTAHRLAFGFSDLPDFNLALSIVYGFWLRFHSTDVWDIVIVL